MKLTAEQIQYNWGTFNANISEHITGDRKQKLLDFYMLKLVNIHGTNSSVFCEVFQQPCKRGSTCVSIHATQVNYRLKYLMIVLHQIFFLNTLVSAVSHIFKNTFHFI